MKRFTREEIKTRLNERLNKKEPIIACEAGVGLVAKMYEMYGIDMIFVTSAAVFRSRGVDDIFSLTSYGECNEMTYEAVRRVHGMTNNTPVIAGLNVQDPRCIMAEQINMFDRAGVSGIINSPSMCAFVSGITVESPHKLESDMLVEARDKYKMFSVADGFFRKDLRKYAEAHPDMIIIDLKWAVDEGIDPSIAFDEEIRPDYPPKSFNPLYYNDVEACCKEVQECYEELKAISPETFILVHGGPFYKFENIQKLFELTDVDGFYGSKCLDTDVMRKYILESQKEFSSLKLSKEVF